MTHISGNFDPMELTRIRGMTERDILNLPKLNNIWEEVDGIDFHHFNGQRAVSVTLKPKVVEVWDDGDVLLETTTAYYTTDSTSTNRSTLKHTKRLSSPTVRRDRHWNVGNPINISYYCGFYDLVIGACISLRAGGESLIDTPFGKACKIHKYVNIEVNPDEDTVSGYYNLSQDIAYLTLRSGVRDRTELTTPLTRNVNENLVIEKFVRAHEYKF